MGSKLQGSRSQFPGSDPRYIGRNTGEAWGKTAQSGVSKLKPEIFITLLSPEDISRTVSEEVAGVLCRFFAPEYKYFGNIVSTIAEKAFHLQLKAKHAIARSAY